MSLPARAEASAEYSVGWVSLRWSSCRRSRRRPRGRRSLQRAALRFAAEVKDRAARPARRSESERHAEASLADIESRPSSRLAARGSHMVAS